MSKFDETLKEVKEAIKTLMTKENIEDSEIETLTKLNGQVDELGRQNQELVEKHSKMKDKYIEGVLNFGTSKKPDEIDGGSPRSMEDIMKDVISKK